jgi:hypothetical protein
VVVFWLTIWAQVLVCSINKNTVTPHANERGIMSQQMVRIVSGRYRNIEISGQEVVLLKDYTVGKKGGYITVDASGNKEVVKLYPKYVNNLSNCKVSVKDKIDFEYLDEKGNVTSNRVVSLPNEEASAALPVELQEDFVSEETDEEVMDRIKDRFEILQTMTAKAAEGGVRAVIVVGPPGVGKSFGVEQELEKYGLLDDIAGRKRKYDVVKGAMTALGLYAKLHAYQDEGNVLVFDDCDSIFHEELSLNIMKAALDSGKRRMIHWNADSNMLRREGIENKFEFKGSVIFITNINFANVRSKKLQDHLAALQSRCHYIDLTLNTRRDKLLRIKQINRDSDLFASYGDFTSKQKDQLLEFMTVNAANLNEVSLRMAIKLADLLAAFGDTWQQVAATTCMKPGSKLVKVK